jgi:hypothetical protein
MFTFPSCLISAALFAKALNAFIISFRKLLQVNLFGLARFGCLQSPWMCSTTIFPSIFQLPTEILQSLIQHICAVPNYPVRVALSLALLSLPEPRQHHLNISIDLSGSPRMDILREWLPRVGPGLVKLNATSSNFDDDFLLALSLSPSARTLKTLDVSITKLSDDSAVAAVWRRFVCLECLDISYCPRAGDNLLRAVSLMPSLRILHAWMPTSVSLAEEIMAQDRLQELEELHLQLSVIATDLAAAKTLLFLLLSHENLKTLSFGLATTVPLFEFHKELPYLTKFIGKTGAAFSPQDLRSVLPFCSNLRWLPLENANISEYSKDDLIHISSSCPLLERFDMDCSSVANDFTMFSCLKVLHVSCQNIHHLTKLPPTLEDLKLLEANTSSSEFAASDEEKQLFIAALCGLTSLTSFCMDINGPLITPSTFQLLVSSLTKLTYLKLLQAAEAAPQLTLVPLKTLLFLRTIRLEVPNLQLDSANLYLPAVVTLEDNACIPMSCTPQQLPNLQDIDPMNWAEGKVEEADEDFFGRFGPQLRSISSITAYLEVSDWCSYLNLSSLSLEEAMPCADAAQVLQSLPNLELFSATIEVDSPDFQWLKHARLLRLRLSLSALDSVVAHINMKWEDMPSLVYFELFFVTNQSANVQFAGLKNLQGVELIAFSKTTDVKAAFEISDCPFTETAFFQSLEFESFKITNVKRSFHIDWLGSRLPSNDDLITMQVPGLDLFCDSDDLKQRIMNLNGSDAGSVDQI